MLNPKALSVANCFDNNENSPNGKNRLWTNACPSGYTPKISSLHGKNQDAKEPQWKEIVVSNRQGLGGGGGCGYVKNDTLTSSVKFFDENEILRHFDQSTVL